MDIIRYKIRLLRYITSLNVYINGNFYLYKKDGIVILERNERDHTIKIKNNNLIIALLKEVGYDDTIFILKDVLTELKIFKKHIIKINYIKL